MTLAPSRRAFHGMLGEAVALRLRRWLATHPHSFPCPCQSKVGPDFSQANCPEPEYRHSWFSTTADRAPTTPHHHGNRICCPRTFQSHLSSSHPCSPAPYVAIPPVPPSPAPADTIAQTKVAAPTRNHPPPRQQILHAESALMGLETYKKRRNDREGWFSSIERVL